MFSKFFINRPIFAAVVSIVIIMAGLVTVQSLPVAQFPEIAPPGIQVTANYPGANAKTVAATVAQPIEEQVNGIENVLYMSSTSTNNGQYTLTVTFEVGTDMDLAQTQVQNRVGQAEALLPQEVQRMGLTVEKQTTTILQFVALTSPDERYDALYLSNYASLHVQNELKRIEGVGSVRIYGASDYSMRVWLNPEQLKARGLTTTDVINAIREQNVQVAAGQIGQSPTPGNMAFQFPINVRGRLSEVEEFEDIIVKTLPGGGMLRVGDVARVEFGAQTYDMSSQTGGQDCAAIGIYLQPGANALNVAEKVHARMAELAETFPPGVDYTVPFDSTVFVQQSIDEVVETLFVTIILVVLVILVFLQNWRATLIPVATIPVSLIGTLAVMSALGVSINMLSLFGIVLAIGIVVDDAIVVVENVIRHMDEDGMSAKQATILTMQEVTGPVVATTLVLLSVFVPTAFMGGITGQLYRQFALTIATATVFSTINALTLSPALSGILLKPTTKSPGLFARGFNAFFDRVQVVYGRMVAGVLRRALLMLVLFAGLAAASVMGFVNQPKGFVPNEDQGWAIIALQLPDAATLDRTKGVIEQINGKLKGMPGVKNFVSIPGFSVIDMAAASNSGVFWVVFDPMEERLAKGQTLDMMMGQLWGAILPIQEAQIFAFPPPPILGVGIAGGFEMQVQDRSHQGLGALQGEAYKLMMAANGDKDLERVFTTFRANVPQLEAHIDRTQTKSLGIPLSDVFDTLQANLGSVYVNDFNRYGKTYQVRVQADADHRAQVEDIRQLEVRNPQGAMVPLGTMVEIENALGPQVVTRFNMHPSAKLNGQGALGVSSGQAMEIMENLAESSLPDSMGFEWSGMSFQEKAAQGKTLFILLMAVVFVYLVLAAQYESWTLPGSVILSVPLAVLGTVLAVMVRGMDINVYTQIGLVLLVALSCKTAILITEFAKAAHEEGQSIREAALNAARLRFRPILMTAFTFILGMIPLVFATGAGANSRQALGTAVFSGMLSATLLLIFFVPVFYAVIQKATETVARKFRKNVSDIAPPKELTTDTGTGSN